jgi:DNA-directed RNA polymerase specialized sigma24 family protein
VTVLAIIQLALGALQSTLPFITKNPAFDKVITEVESAIASLTSVQQKIVDLNELEGLRTQKTW